MSDYADERAAHPEPIKLVITTKVPSKWRFVDLETGDVWRSDGAQMTRAEDQRVLVAKDDRIQAILDRPGMRDAVTARRSQLRQADREELSRLLDLLEKLKAAVRLLYPDEMTPQAKRVFDSILEGEG